MKINGEDVFVGPDGYFSEIILLESGNNVLVIEATNRFDRTAKQVRNILYEKKIEPVPADFSEDDTFEVGDEENIFFEGEIEFIGP